jgi:hypothetical protein
MQEIVADSRRDALSTGEPHRGLALPLSTGHGSQGVHAVREGVLDRLALLGSQDISYRLEFLLSDRENLDAPSHGSNTLAAAAGRPTE